tara:strand:- start:90 stop:332 length:243 start_codon:yes stop_codon:yes gene_type:complete
MEQKLLNALVAHYNANLQRAEANLLNYFKNSAGIGEHPDIVGEMAKLVDEVGSARGSLQVLNDMVATQQPAPEVPAEEGE